MVLRVVSQICENENCPRGSIQAKPSRLGGCRQLLLHRRSILNGSGSSKFPCPAPIASLGTVCHPVWSYLRIFCVCQLLCPNRNEAAHKRLNMHAIVVRERSIYLWYCLLGPRVPGKRVRNKQEPLTTCQPPWRTPEALSAFQCMRAHDGLLRPWEATNVGNEHNPP